MNEEKMDEIIFRLIAAAGTAKGLYVEAVALARKGNFEEAAAKIKEGEKIFLEGHRAHAELLNLLGQQPVNVMLVHAEDQMMATETYRMFADDMIELLKQLKKQ